MFFSLCAVIAKILGIFSILVNLLLIPLIWYRSSKELGSYSYLLLTYTLIGLFFSLIIVIGLPIFGPSEYGWIIYASSVNIPQNYGYWIVVLYCFCYVAELLTITLCFIYRYLSVCNRGKLIWFREWKRVLFILTITSTIALIWTGVTVIYLQPTEELNQIFADSVYNNTRLEIGNISYIAGIAFHNDQIVLTFFLIFLLRCGVILTSIAVIIFCLVKIIRVLRYVNYGTTENRRSGKTQKKLFILLIIQMLVPLLLVYAPAVSSYIIAFCRFHAPDLSMFYTVLMPLAQLIDPLMIIFLVPDYRRAARAILCRITTRYQLKLQRKVNDCYTITRSP